MKNQTHTCVDFLAKVLQFLQQTFLKLRCQELMACYTNSIKSLYEAPEAPPCRSTRAGFVHYTLGRYIRATSNPVSKHGAGYVQGLNGIRIILFTNKGNPMQTHTDPTPLAVDDGFVTLTDHMGSDLSVINAARVSFGKRKTQMDEKDIKLIQYLAAHKHMSPFRHVVFSFTLEGISEVVCRQLYKHQVGCAYTSGEFREVATTWNEVSGRYVSFDPEFHQPEQFRKQHKSNKQASVEGEMVDNNQEAQRIYRQSIENSFQDYKKLLELGVCKEQARMVMPLSFKNSLVWTTSLEATVHFIKLRDHAGAQLEIRNLARAIYQLIDPICPHSIAALLSL